MSHRSTREFTLSESSETVASSRLPWVVLVITKHTVVNLCLLLLKSITHNSTDNGANAARASRLLASLRSISQAPLSKVQHATAYKGREWLVTGCQCCQSLTWCCSPEPSPPLSLLQLHLDHAHLQIPPLPDFRQGAIQPNLLPTEGLFDHLKH